MAARDRVAAIVDSVISLGQKTGEAVSVTVNKPAEGGYTFVIDGHSLASTNKAEAFLVDVHAAVGNETDLVVAKESSRKARRIKSLEASIAAIQAVIASEG